MTTTSLTGVTSAAAWTTTDVNVCTAWSNGQVYRLPVRIIFGQFGRSFFKENLLTKERKMRRIMRERDDFLLFFFVFMPHRIVFPPSFERQKLKYSGRVYKNFSILTPCAIDVNRSCKEFDRTKMFSFNSIKGQR